MNSNKAMMARRSDAVPRGVGQIHPSSPNARRTAGCGTWKAGNISILPAVSRCSIPATCIRRLSPPSKTS